MTISKELLNELKERLITRKSRIEEELSKFTHKNSDGVLKANFPKDLGSEKSENANEVEEYADRLAIEKNLEKELENINAALERMEKGTYGFDVKTGKEINMERLKACPSASENV